MFNQQHLTLPLNYSIGLNQRSQAVFGPEGAIKLTACRLNRDLQSVSCSLCKRSSIIRGLHCFCIPPSILHLCTDKPRPLPLADLQTLRADPLFFLFFKTTNPLCPSFFQKHTVLQSVLLYGHCPAFTPRPRGKDQPTSQLIAGQNVVK